MREDCIKMTPDESKNVHIWYIHSKGISTKHQNPRTHLKIRDWRRLMEYFVITNWRDCVKTLENGFDTAGINYHLSPSPHYPGTSGGAPLIISRSCPNYYPYHAITNIQNSG